MTLLDAPKFDAARSRRNTLIFRGSAAGLVVLFIACWLLSGRPVDWPWFWHRYAFGRSSVNHFLSAVESNDLPKAYSIWVHDRNWQQHPQQYTTYPFTRFQNDWSANSPGNEYGAFKSHKIALAARYGNGVLIAVLVNGRKMDALNLEYDTRTRQLSYSPPGVSLYLGP
jgi:hypothetical protein